VFLTTKKLKDMEAINEKKLRKPRRSKADIETAIQKAAITQIKKKGFARVLVTDIVKRAKIEPIVFYNRFKNLDEFYDEFVKRYDYWISDLTRSFNPSIDSEKGYVDAIHTLLDALLDDSLMAELLRWEIAEGTTITERTAKLREIDFNAIISRYGQACHNDVDGLAISALIIAGIYFMVLHKDRSTFAGIDLNSTEGKQRIKTSIKQLGNMLYDFKKNEDKRNRLAACLKREGLDSAAIERCLAEVYE